jgi:hypothetical protein
MYAKKYNYKACKEVESIGAVGCIEALEED